MGQNIKRISVFLLAALTDLVRAGNLFQITGYNTLVTAHRSDLATFMALNARHNKPDDSVARLRISNRVGFIARADLDVYLGSR